MLILLEYDEVLPKVGGSLYVSACIKDAVLRRVIFPPLFVGYTFIQMLIKTGSMSCF